VRKGISFVLQGSRVFTDLSVKENLEVGGIILPKKEARQRVEEVLGFFPDLKLLLRRNAGALSTGEKQMLAMGRAMMLKPRLLLADEPSLGLGPKLMHSALASIKALNESSGTAVLLVEQNVREAMAICGRVYALRLGKVVLEDKPENLSIERLRQAFLS
jgi:branched-chain amino acid transport system ATP-binding protein